MSKLHQFIIAIVLITFIVIMRLIPHPANVAPVAAAALFAGVYLSKRWALVVPLIAMLVSDLAIGTYEPIIMLSVYGCFAFSVVLGMWVRRNKNALTVVTASLGGSIVFFLVTNFAVWAVGSWYPHTLAGFLTNYTLALPFFRNTLLGDLFFVGAFFGAAEAVRVFAKLRRAAVTSRVGL
ncbi:MAG: hypothetical protein Q7S89_01375 [bacterium]|nr:hypothetical protein [bacterium]